MHFHLATAIDGQRFIRCQLTSKSETIAEPILCFSLQAPAKIISGGAKIEGLGGFSAVRLAGTLSPDTPLEFCIGFENPCFLASNRAWHPQGPYLRLANEAAQVDTDLYLGVRPSKAPEPQRPANGLALIPAPAEWHEAGEPFSSNGFAIAGAFGDAVRGIAALAARLGASSFSRGQTPLLLARNDSIHLEGYRLRIREEGVSLDASAPAGARYGLITLLELLMTREKLPQGCIEDQPRFEWRGFMLDCVREFYPVESIAKLLDLMALLKLNRFHWHFADDEAFRPEVACAPDLWKRSAFRGEGLLIPGVFGGRPGPTGGSYSKEDIQSIIDHASSLSIEVLPEIEVPAHALALTAIRPELRDPRDIGSETSIQGYHRNVMNPALQETWDLVEPLALEIAGLFPFGHIHLGGDELPDNTWDGSPLAGEYKKTHGLENHRDVLGHLMHRLAGKVRASGHTPCAWQEAAEGCTGGIGNDAILFSWTGAGPGRKAAQAGYRVVMCPAQHCYFDMAHTTEADDWGANWAANFGLDKSFDWDPIPEPALADKIVGVQGAFWSEFTSEPKQIEAMIAPRIFGLASKGWSPEGGTSLAELRASAACYGPVMDALAWDVNWDAVYRDTPDSCVRRVDP